MTRVYVKVTQQEFNDVWKVLFPMERVVDRMPQGEEALVILDNRIAFVVDKDRGLEERK